MRAKEILSEVKQRLDAKCWKGKHKEGTKIKGGIRVNNCVPNESVNPAQQAAIAISKKKEQGMDEDWQSVNKKDKTDGMSSKAVKAYRRENPGSKLKTAVTKKPSELKAGSKDAKRRKSFCARMSGVKGPMKDEKGRPTAKAKALSRWNCESVEALGKAIAEAALGTNPKRPARPGSRPDRGHEPQKRYKSDQGISKDKETKFHAKLDNLVHDTFGKRDDEMAEQFCEECGGTIWGSISEHGKASRELCKSSKPDADLGASMLASCKSQGLRARDGNKSHKLGKSPDSRVKVGGHRIKGQKYGGPLPDWS